MVYLHRGWVATAGSCRGRLGCRPCGAPIGERITSMSFSRSRPLEARFYGGFSRQAHEELSN